MDVIGYFIIVLSLLAIGNVFTYSLQELFIFRPKHLDPDYTYSFPLPFEEFFLETPENGHINVLWFHTEGQQRPVVAYYHGNSNNLSDWGSLSTYFNALGYDFLIYDFRGFGKSRGKSNERTFHLDARAVYDFARKHYAPEEIVIFGRSMGTGVASKLASEVEARLLILETPYYSIKGLFKAYYPFLPASLFLFKYTFPTYKWLGKMKTDAYIFQGTRDFVVPYRCAKLLKPYLNDPKHFITISGGKHTNLSEFPEYNDGIRSLLGNSGH